MDALTKQLKELGEKFNALPKAIRLLAAGAVVVLVATIAIGSVLRSNTGYSFVFTKLQPEESAEAAAILKGSGISVRVEAGGGGCPRSGQ